MTTRKPAPKAAAAAATDVTQTIEATVAAAQEAASKNVEQAVAYTKEQMDKVSKQVFSAYDELAGFQKENVDAVLASSTVLAKGMENLSKAVMAFSQAQIEQSMAAAKAMAGVKTLRELVDLQTEFARTSFDAMIAEATKVSEMSVKVANEAIEPISARVNATVEKMGKFKAAA